MLIKYRQKHIEMCALHLILLPILFIRNKSENFLVLFIRNIDQVSSIFEAKFHLCLYLL